MKAPSNRWQVPLAIGAVVLALLISGMAWYLWYQNEIQSCRDAVAERQDDRSMWEYLVETRADPDNPETAAFIAHLNDRLPRLRCNGTTLVTIPPEEE